MANGNARTYSEILKAKFLLQGNTCRDPKNRAWISYLRSEMRFIQTTCPARLQMIELTGVSPHYMFISCK